MSTAFQEELAAHDVAWTVADPGDVADTVAALLREPAVGVEPSIPGATLPDAVDTAPSPADLDAAATGVTPATLGLADHGSVVLSADAAGTEPVSLFPAFHVAILPRSAVVPDLRVALDELGATLRDGGSAVVATGPSATADMGELVRGAHGPEEVHVVIVDDEEPARTPGDAAGDGGCR